MTTYTQRRRQPGGSLAAWHAARASEPGRGHRRAAMVGPRFALLVWLVLCGGAAAQQTSPLHQLFEDVQETVAQSGLLGGAAQPSTNGDSEGERAESRGATAAARQYPPPGSLAEDPLPPPRIEGRLPLAGSEAGDDVRLTQSNDGLITLVVRDAALSKVLALIAENQHLNIVTSDAIDKTITISLYNVPLEEALTSILSVANYTWVRKNNIILITSLADAGTLPASVQGRQIQVFELDFAKASAVAEAISTTGFLSPVGKVSITESSSTDNRRTREMVVVEDLAEPLSRISAYINYVDQPPRQVQIEAHILQVTLDDTNRQGVDLSALFRIANSDFELETVGLANAAAPTAFLATLKGGDLGSVIELLQTTTDTKSLGSPKLLVMNEQEARLQVGDQLGFRVTTTTETSTMESVQFLDVGVILTMTPRITRDNRVLLSVKPEVSTGQVNPETGLPEEQSTEVETDVMLESGQGMVIGGLIKETDSVVQSKIPYLGDVKGLGWFFRNSEVTKERVEIIVALIPRVQPYDPEWQAFEQGELVRAGVPLLDGPLCRTNRPWDPVLPDGVRVTKPLIPHRPPWESHERLHYPRPMDYYIPRHPLPEQQYFDEACEPMLEGSPLSAPFLSDDSLPPPEGSDGWENVEIISDQP